MHSGSYLFSYIKTKYLRIDLRRMALRRGMTPGLAGGVVLSLP